jgi:two-component system, OmpR family, response regulator
MQTRVLVVEDDPGVAAGLVKGLQAAGFSVELATNGQAGLTAVFKDPPDIVVLDLMLPERSGLELLEEFQNRKRAPIIVLTARTDLPDRLRCFELGAVDFVPKPFFLEELVARIRSHLGQRKSKPRRIVHWANITLDLDASTALKDSQALALTRSEFDLLAYLVERRGRAIARSTLAREVLSLFVPSDERTVDVHIGRIRKKLGDDAAAAIVTVWGIGYRFEEDKA